MQTAMFILVSQNKKIKRRQTNKNKKRIEFLKKFPNSQKIDVF